jgi:hypothetical protein
MKSLFYLITIGKILFCVKVKTQGTFLNNSLIKEDSFRNAD